MRTNKGLTLVETLMAITLFGVLSAATAGLMLSSITLRSSNQNALQADQFVKQVLERHKDYWSVKDSFNSIPTYISNSLQSDVPENWLIDISYACLDEDGNFLNSDPSPLACAVTNPPLRRVTVSLYEGEKLLSSHFTDIGLPAARKAEE